MRELTIIGVLLCSGLVELARIKRCDEDNEDSWGNEPSTIDPVPLPEQITFEPVPLPESMEPWEVDTATDDWNNWATDDWNNWPTDDWNNWPTDDWEGGWTDDWEGGWTDDWEGGRPDAQPHTKPEMIITTIEPQEPATYPEPIYWGNVGGFDFN